VLALARRSPPRSACRRRQERCDAYAALRVRCCSAVVITVGALTFVPALALGPVVETPAHPRRSVTARANPRGIDMTNSRRQNRTASPWLVGRDAMRTALVDSFRRPDATLPVAQSRDVRRSTSAGILTTVLWIQALAEKGEAARRLHPRVAFWLWSRWLFANFAEAIAEGRSKAQAASLKSARKDTIAKKLAQPHRGRRADAERRPRRCARATSCWWSKGDLVPGDGEVIEGVRRDQRERDHRRELAGDPRRGQRLQHGDGRHPGAVRTGSSSASASIRARRSSTG